ncbi:MULTISPECIES: efflux RND transporter periplasmic adaptor subunit [unclassified Acinetobacter]|uniref:efflux RND transporter periplasmic adaptor subunit n=1 Tax=unclassified Acinetobacter TaxID=196816 RepID=UPI0035BA4995
MSASELNGNKSTPPKNVGLKTWQMVLIGISLLLIGVLLGKVFSQSNKQGTSNNTTTANGTTPASSEKNAALTVETIVPSMQSISNNIIAQGVIEGKEVLQLSPRVNGVAIESVLVKEGDYVRQGQVLATFDQRQQQQQQKQSQADILEAQARLEKATADLARVEPLLTDNAVSRQEVDAYRTAKKQAQAALIAAQARAEGSQINIQNSRLVAPVSGLIHARRAEVGMLTSGAPLFDLIKNNELEWQATLSPLDSAKVTIGTQALINLPNGQQATGQVERISANATQSREMTIHVALQQNTAIKVGLFQRGQFVIGEKRGISVPATAISSYDGKDYVWQVKMVERDAYQVNRVPVQVLQRHGDQAMIEGITASSMLVKQGANFLNDGDYVRVVNTHSQAASSPATTDTNTTVKP